MTFWQCVSGWPGLSTVVGCWGRYVWDFGVMGFISGASFPLVHKLVKTQFLSGLEIFFSKSVKIVVCKIPETHLGFGKGFFGMVFRIY